MTRVLAQNRIRHRSLAARIARLAEEETGNRQAVVVARERGGRTLAFVLGKESESIPTVRRRIPIGSIVRADEAWVRTGRAGITSCAGSTIPSSPARTGPAPTRPSPIFRAHALRRGEEIDALQRVGTGCSPR